MPMYEYRCSECGKQFEMLRRMRDADCGLKCPSCESENVTRLLSSFATSATSASSGGCGSGGGGGRFS